MTTDPVDTFKTQWLNQWPDDVDVTEQNPEEELQVAEAMLVLSEMARERGVDKIADLGDPPPLDPETKARYLARARERIAAEKEVPDDAA